MGTLILTAVLFWVLREFIAGLIVVACIAIGAGIGKLRHAAKEGAAIGAIVGWFVAVCWSIYAIVEMILNIVAAVQMAAG